MLSLPEKVDPSHCALVVVDVQNDFCHPEGAMGKAGFDLSMIDEVLAPLIETIEDARRAGVPVIFIQTIHSHRTDSEAWLSRLPTATNSSRLCAPGSWGMEFYEIAPLEQERVVVKHRYSGFYGTDMDVMLRAIGAKTLVMSGFATNVCVETTARDGFMRDYRIVFLSDCTGTYVRGEHQPTLTNMSKYFGVVATSKDVRDVWKSFPARQSR